jgi:hypothetical protein
MRHRLSEDDRTRFRVFDDYLGRRWEVWQTNPSESDRRAQDRRNIPDRRRRRRTYAPDRRSENDRRAQPAARFPGVPLERGWLCFERQGQGERKRLAPVPELWETADEMTLAALCNFASEQIKRW